MSFIAKGARNPKSKFGSALEIFTHAEIIFYKSVPKSVYTLSDAIPINFFPNLKYPDKFFYANQLIELIHRTSAPEDSNQSIYNLLLSSLNILDTTRYKKKSNYMSLVTAFFLKTAAMLGYQPELNHCVLCKNTKASFFSIECGGIICNSENHHQYDCIYGINHIKSMRYLLTNPLNKSINFSIAKSTLELVQNYLVYHLEKVNLHSLKY